MTWAMNSTMIQEAIKNAPFPKNEGEFRQQLQEVASMKYQEGISDTLNKGRDGKLNDEDLYNGLQLREKLRQQQVNRDYIIKCALRKVEGVFRMPEDVDELLKRLKELMP